MTRQTVMYLVVFVLFLNQGPQGQSVKRTDADILKMLQNARDQADSWVNMGLGFLGTKAAGGNTAADTLMARIAERRKQQHKWELSVWIPTQSSLLPDELIDTEMGNGEVLITGTPRTAAARGVPVDPSLNPDQRLGYVVTAPVEVRSRILMEGLRQDLFDYTELLEFDGLDVESSVPLREWKSAWFDAQALYCKTNLGGKFTDLNNEVQTCRSK